MAHLKRGFEWQGRYTKRVNVVQVSLRISPPKTALSKLSSIHLAPEKYITMTVNTASDTNGHKTMDWTKFWNVIDGRLESTKETCDSINPATGKPWGNVPLSTQDDVETALKAAKTAFKSWSTTTWESRAELIQQYADAIEAEKANFAELLVNEQGKPVCCPSSRPNASFRV